MSLLDFFAAGPNLPFLVTGSVVLALLIINIVLLVFGAGFDAFHHDIDVTVDANGNGIPDYLETGHFTFSDLVNPGHVPSTIFLILFCGQFSILGYSGQWIYDGVTGGFAPMLLSIPVIFALTLPCVRLSTQVISPLLPKDETNAVTVESLTNTAGIVTAGPIGPEDFGMARFTDNHGVDHMLMVCSEGEEVIATGANVVLLGPHRERNFAFIVRKI